MLMVSPRGRTTVSLLGRVLLHHSAFPVHQQSALAVVIDRFATLPQQPSSIALLLAIGIGQCCSLSQLLRQQLIALLDAGLSDVLLAGLTQANAARDHHAAATIIRAVRFLVLLQPARCDATWSSPQHYSQLLQAACGSSAAADAGAALAVTLAVQGFPAELLLHDLTTPAAAQHSGATATASASSTSSRRAWAAGGLQPLLLQLQCALQAQQQQQQQAVLAPPASSPCTQSSLAACQHSGLDGSPGTGTLLALLRAAVCVTDGLLLDSPVLATLDSFCSNPAVVATLRAALLAPAAHVCQAPTFPTSTTAAEACAAIQGLKAQARQPVALEDEDAAVSAAETASTQGHEPASCTADSNAVDSNLSSCGSTDRRAGYELQAAALQLVNTLAAHTSGLAQQCLQVLAPVLPEALTTCSDASLACSAPTAAVGHRAASVAEGLSAAAAAAAAEAPGAAAAAQGAAARAAVLRVWQQLLRKGRRPALHNLLQQWLPVAAGSLAAAGSAVNAAVQAAAEPVPPSPCGQDCLEAYQQQQQWHSSAAVVANADDVAAAFIPLASELQSASTRLALAAGPSALMQLLTPHVLNLTQLLHAAAAAAQRGRAAVAGAGAGCNVQCPSERSSAPVVTGSVLLLAIWLLQSWVAALQQLQASHPTAATAAVTTSPGGWQSSSGLSNALEGQEGLRTLATVRSGLLQSVSALVAAPCTDHLQVRCQSMALHLAQALLEAQPVHQLNSCSCYSAGGSNTHPAGASTAVVCRVCDITASGHGSRSSSASSRSSSAGAVLQHGGEAGARTAAAAATATPLRQLLVALGSLFSRHPQNPRGLAHRTLLQTATRVLMPVAQALLQPDPHQQQQEHQQQQGDCEQQQCQCQQQQRQEQRQVCKGLVRDLRSLQQDLQARKLERSSSTEELLQCVEDTLAVLGGLLG